MDAVTIRIVVTLLAVLCGFCIFGIAYVEAHGTQSGQSLPYTLFVAIGAITGLLINTKPPNPPSGP